jgi:HAD superfamily hydrolase (TIGR01450 family)
MQPTPLANPAADAAAPNADADAALDARLAAVRGLLVDMDGTLYIGQKAMPGAAEFMAYAQTDGLRRIVLTNNSSNARERYRDRLSALGIEVALDDVLTSGDSSAEWLAAHTELRRPFVLGSPALEDACVRAGLKPMPAVPEYGTPAADCVLLGYDTTLTYAKLTDACLLVARGLPYYATHADRTCIDPRGLLPDAGAFIAAIEITTDQRPTVLGKPATSMLDAGLRRLGTPPELTLMVGDQLDTDLTLGLTHGLVSVLVLTGETSRARYEASGLRADLVVDDVGQLLARLKSARGRLA